MDSMKKLQPVYSAEQIRVFEQDHISKKSIDAFSLMQQAGLQAWNRIQEMLLPNSEVHIFCGPGNNGGDGWILAQQAYLANKTTYVWYTEPKSATAIQAKELALSTMNHQHCFNMGELHSSLLDKLNGLRNAQLNICIVDALFGIGLNKPVTENYADLIDQLNSLHCLRIALDIPSGINADTAECLGTAFKADYTISFIALKQGLCRDSGKVHAGNIILESLNVDSNHELLRHMSTQHKQNHIFMDHLTSDFLPKRNNHSHKGSYGNLICVGGDIGIGGAIIIAAESAMSFGAGKVFIASHKDFTQIALTRCPSIMTINIDKISNIDEIKNVNNIPSSLEQLQNHLKYANSLVLGPGLGQSEWSLACFKACFTSVFHGAVVLDADALNLIATNDEAYHIVMESPLKKILTPHPKEAQRLYTRISKNTHYKKLSPFEIAFHISQHFDAICLLKGYGSIVADDTRSYICTRGNAALAKAGQGDCLSGMIGALLAQNLSTVDATRYAAWAQGLASEVWSIEQSELSLLPHETAKLAARAIKHSRR